MSLPTKSPRKNPPKKVHEGSDKDEDITTDLSKPEHQLRETQEWYKQLLARLARQKLAKQKKAKVTREKENA